MRSKEINPHNKVFSILLDLLQRVVPMEYPRHFTDHIDIRAIFLGVFVGSCRIQELA
jgi:hypothetical protein